MIQKFPERLTPAPSYYYELKNELTTQKCVILRRQLEQQLSKPYSSALKWAYYSRSDLNCYLTILVLP